MKRFLIASAVVLCIAAAVGVFLLQSPGKRVPPDLDRDPEIRRLRAAMKAVEPLHAPMGATGPFDWLAFYPEPGQTFLQYLKGRPTTPEDRRRILYIQPLGELRAAQRRIVQRTAEYMEVYFNLPVRIRPVLVLGDLPARARRNNALMGTEQMLTSYVLHNLLRPRLPPDGAALIALTSSDLYPGEQMNFVFGQASLKDRVGVWSLHRLGDPGAGRREFQECLLRTLKIAAHETGHMFSLRHCTKYECTMNGSNSLEELDRRPLGACPECMAKLCWATSTDPEDRYRALANFCRSQGLEKKARFFEESAGRVSGLGLS